MIALNRIHLLKFSIIVLVTFITTHSWASTYDLTFEKFQAPASNWLYKHQTSLNDTELKPVNSLSVTGGSFWYQADITITESNDYVIDFKNSSTIAQFRHFIYDASNRLIDTLEGGIENTTANTFFLRHGRAISLPPGQYRLISELSSPFFLAQPEPYIDTLSHYRQAIKPGNALVLLCMGIFLGLGTYYTFLALSRFRRAEAMYALFILGNLLFNGTSLLVFPDLLGINWFYLASVPILISNCAYIVFVMSLLEIREKTHPRLYSFGVASVLIMGTFIIAAAAFSNWSLELARYGVGIFLMYGLTAGSIRAYQGSISARFYLIAIAIFFILGGVAITQTQVTASHTIYIEHIGLLAVAVEIILLAFVLVYQFAELHREKERFQTRLAHSNHIAYTDELTGLSNRYALDKALNQLTENSSLTYIDLDRLKYYNDKFGHSKGDELLRNFAKKIENLLKNRATIYRVGGDEFSILCPAGDIDWVEKTISETVAYLHNIGFEEAGASAGTAYKHECNSKSDLKHLADIRMYEKKQQRKTIMLEAS